jgi:hypothetical protein
MAESNHTALDLGLDSASVKKGVIYGVIPRPNGGGNFVHGFNSRVTTSGVAGYFVNNVNFAPAGEGASIRSCIQRGISGGPLNFAPFIFASAQGNSVADSGYIIGLEDADPHRIVFRKGALSGGLPSGSIGSNGIWSKSTATYAPGTWLHLRMDAITEPNGDVVLQFFQSDLAVHTWQSPVWVPIPGMTEFVDDHLEIATNSPPLASGYGGFAFQTRDVNRRGFFKKIEYWRQL